MLGYNSPGLDNRGNNDPHLFSDWWHWDVPYLSPIHAPSLAYFPRMNEIGSLDDHSNILEKMFQRLRATIEEYFIEALVFL